MTRSAIGFDRCLRLAGIAMSLGLAVLSLPASAMNTGGTDTVRSLYDSLLTTMRNGPTLGARGRFAQIAPVVHRVFDVPLMTRLAVGPHWESANETQRQQISRAFERYITAIYAERFDSYSGEKLQVTGERQSPSGTIITSQIVKSTGEPVNISYLMRNNGGQSQIADVYLDGTISELATRRSEFASILRQSGVDGLIAALNSKADALGAARTTYAAGAIGAR
jgi:phospholipid transport system substrate-binding protein